MSYITEIYKPLKINKSYKSVKTSNDQIISTDKANEILRSAKRFKPITQG